MCLRQEMNFFLCLFDIRKNKNNSQCLYKNPFDLLILIFSSSYISDFIIFVLVWHGEGSYIVLLTYKKGQRQETGK